MRGSWPAAIVMVATACGPSIPSGYSPAEGDVLFQSLPPSPLVAAIEGATQSPFSHCGMLASRGGAWVVIEAFGSVRETRLEDWIARGRGEAMVAFRWKGEAQAKAPALVAAARRLVGQTYDFHYAFDNDAIYCSELVYLAAKEALSINVGKTLRLSELNWKPFEDFIKDLEGGDVPLDREIITPRALTEAPELEMVFGPGL